MTFPIKKRINTEHLCTLIGLGTRRWGGNVRKHQREYIFGYCAEDSSVVYKKLLQLGN